MQLKESAASLENCSKPVEFDSIVVACVSRSRIWQEGLFQSFTTCGLQIL